MEDIYNQEFEKEYSEICRCYKKDYKQLSYVLFKIVYEYNIQTTKIKELIKKYENIRDNLQNNGFPHHVDYLNCWNGYDEIISDLKDLIGDSE